MKRYPQVTSAHELSVIANGLRQDVIRMLSKSSTGHTGGPLGMADIFAALYFNILKHDPSAPDDSSRDYLFLSNGHICPIQYVALAGTGYFPKEELATLRKINSRLQGHPHNSSLPGIENSGGPLGQGISQAVGAALALQLDGKKNKVFCICGDGELDEGQTWEAALLASKHKLRNYIQIVDHNKIQLDGDVENIMPLGSLEKKFKAFGFNVLSCDGNDMHQVLSTLSKALKARKGPVVIIAHTIPGKGVSFMEGKYQWHGKTPNAAEAEQALGELQSQLTQLSRGNAQ